MIVTWLFFRQGNMSRVIPVSVLGVFVLLEACHAHLCLISPTQRGSLAGINKQGMICPPPKKSDYETVTCKTWSHVHATFSSVVYSLHSIRRIQNTAKYILQVKKINLIAWETVHTCMRGSRYRGSAGVHVCVNFNLP